MKPTKKKADNEGIQAWGLPLNPNPLNSKQETAEGPGMLRRGLSLTEGGASRPQVTAVSYYVTALSYYVTGLLSSHMFCDCSITSSKSERGSGLRGTTGMLRGRPTQVGVEGMLGKTHFPIFFVY